MFEKIIILDAFSYLQKYTMFYSFLKNSLLFIFVGLHECSNALVFLEYITDNNISKLMTSEYLCVLSQDQEHTIQIRLVMSCATNFY